MTEPKPVPVADGSTITIDVLRWNEGWEFDCPVCVIRPVIVFSPNGDSADQMVESLCIDASIDGVLRDEGTEDGLIDRTFPLRALKRRWAAARRGVEFPIKQYEAFRFRVRFVRNAENELDFDVEEDS
jgi:hypothetical protein